VGSEMCIRDREGDMDKNWLAWWLVIFFSTIFTLIGLLIRVRRWKNE